jgi:hypothetical protein
MRRDGSSARREALRKRVGFHQFRIRRQQAVVNHRKVGVDHDSGQAVTAERKPKHSAFSEFEHVSTEPSASMMRKRRTVLPNGPNGTGQPWALTLNVPRRETDIGGSWLTDGVRGLAPRRMPRVHSAAVAHQQISDRVLPFPVAFPASVVSRSFTLFATFSSVERAAWPLGRARKPAG